MKRLLALVTALCLTFLLFSLATQWVSDNGAYYRRQMIQNDIPRVTGKSLKELDEISDGLRDYLKRGDEKALTPYFSKSEVDHMVDVYALFHLMRRLSLAGYELLFSGERCGDEGRLKKCRQGHHRLDRGLRPIGPSHRRELFKSVVHLPHLVFL